ncbi:FKBP-type peptidyl-prolyl cis-trans isomerase [Novosphingobium huizhouense]|uniref:FKBP-type peptidyl-prolyl cis-trans isomerase n=1 Tax=Novosphingobium huizhouense TaxID=2866625 RepID=UPI001CD8A2D6|nr:FKBP-type peptidyl-prolyl cis-trans isomerase [Novosphingobium huizhouense]
MITTLPRHGALASLLALALSAAPACAAETAPAPAAAAAAASPDVLAVPLMPTVGAQYRTCSAKTASGLGYQVLKAGTGPKPGKNDFVLINYIGYLAATGAVFDQNVSAPLNLDAVIPGFAEGLQTMPRDSIYRLCIPAALGYGANASEKIPANSDLVFQIQLIDSKTIAEVEAMRAEMQKEQAAQQAGATAAPKAKN